MSELKYEDFSYPLADNFLGQRTNVDFYVPTNSGYMLVWVFATEQKTWFQFIKDGTMYVRTVNRAYDNRGVSRMAKRWYHEVLEGA